MAIQKLPSLQLKQQQRHSLARNGNGNNSDNNNNRTGELSGQLAGWPDARAGQTRGEFARRLGGATLVVMATPGAGLLDSRPASLLAG